MNKYKVRQLFQGTVESELLNVGFDNSYLPKAKDKYSFNLIKIYSLRSPAANILKQNALSKGADLGVARHVIDCSYDFSDAILAATDKQLIEIIESIKNQDFGLKQLATELKTFLKNKYSEPRTLQIKNKKFFWGTQTYIMGILNITPDSFSDGGKFLEIDQAVQAAGEILQHNATIIDIGGESTKPFSEPVDPDLQLQRIIPVVDEIIKQFPDAIISVDTRSSKVASEVIEHGVSIINDVSGLQYDPEMAKVIAQNKVPIVIMHSLSSPDTMQNNPEYVNLMDEITHFLIDTTEKALKKGILPENIILDPGIGFGKTIDHNLEIIQRISEIKSLGYPVLVGASRKSFIGKLLDCDVQSREEGTAAANAYLISQKVDILRLHDVKFHSKVIKLMDNIVRSKF